MITGLVTFSYMVIKKDESVFKLDELKRKCFTIALVMLLSTARTGWLMMAIWFFITPWIEDPNSSMFSGRKLTRIILAVLVLFAAFMALIILHDLGIDFLNGTGIAGTANHSDRSRNWPVILGVFMDSPFIGYSLGGIDPVYAARAGKVYVTGQNGVGGNVWLEALLASGVFGIIPFVIYFVRLLQKRSAFNDETFNALKWGLIFIMLALNLNQNILRVYFWWHIAILSACYKHNKLKLKLKTEALALK